MRTFDNLFHFLEYLASFTHDGVEVFLKLFYEWRIIVANLLNDEGIDVPCVIEGDSVVCHLIQGVLSQIVDVFCLQRYFFVVFHRMEIAVYQYLPLLQIALVEDFLVGKMGLILLHFLKMLGMNTADGYAQSTYVHHQAAVSVDADDVSSFQSSHLTRGNTEEDAIASIIMVRVKQETDAFR